MLDELNDAQKKAVEYIDGPLLIVAGAGTGKTKVITEKIAYLIETGKAKPEEILALTFTDKAATEMRDRVDGMLPLGYSDLAISTFHGFCQTMLQEFGMHIGVSASFKLFTETDAWLLMKEHMDVLPLTYFRPLGNANKHIHELLTHFSKCKDELLTPVAYLTYAENQSTVGDEAYQEERERTCELARVYAAYNQLLLDKGAMDFGDVIYYAVSLLQNRPSIKKIIQTKYKYILVDEFQDVNWAQYVLVKELSEQAQLTVVGDDDQSIYAFRGSNVGLILRFKDDYKNAHEIVLNENYRSRQEILDLAYQSIQHNNPHRLESTLSIDKRLRASGAGMDMPAPESVVQHMHYHTLDEEIYGVTNEILHLKETKDISWDDIVVLVRANSHTEPLLSVLESARIPYEFLASSGLYRQSIVIDAFNFLITLDNSNESTALFRLFRLPMMSIDAEDIHKITTYAKKKTMSYYEALSHTQEYFLSGSASTTIKKLQTLIAEGMARSQTEKTSAVLYHFLEDSGYLAYLTHEEERGNQEVTRQIFHVKQFFDCIEKFEETAVDAHVSHFVAYYRSLLEAGDEGSLSQPEDTPDSVNIMTVHASKGLEFKYVFILNLVEERFPTRRRSEGLEVPAELVHEKQQADEAHIEEERRLFYVAVTRAKEKIYLVSSEDYGGSRKKKLSRFLAEVGLSGVGKSATPASLLGKSAGEVPLVEPERTVYELPKQFSFSQIKSYQTCPYQYKLAHILKLPTKGSASFSFGTSMHNTLQKFYQQIQTLNAPKQESLFAVPKEQTNVQSNILVPPLAELYTLYETCWIPDWYKNKRERDEYYKKGKDILRIYYAAQEGIWTIPVNLESSFKIKIGDALLRGRIDRIDQLEDGTLEIIDYKTGKQKTTLTADDKEQLLIYQIATETMPEYAHVGRASKLTFYYLNDNIQTSFVGKDTDLERLRSKVIEAVDGIKSGNFQATPDPYICGYCDFREMCEYRAK